MTGRVTSWAFPTAVPEEVGLSSAGLDRVDAALRQLVDDGVLAGASTLVARHGKVARTTILGVDDVRRGKPLTPDTIFRLFSMTKPVTGVAMGILADRGLWRPDQPVEQHLPELAGLMVAAGTDGDGKPILEAPEHPPTMGELLTHTAGFSYGMDRSDPLDLRYRKLGVLRAHGLDDLVRRVARAPLAYQPGTRWKYSISVDLQGAIIERLSGQPLAEFFQEHLLGPLGMTDTGFFTPPDQLARRATLYYTGGKHRLRPIRNPMFRDRTRPPRFPMAGAGLVSTIGDYARFCQMLLNGGELGGVRILSEEAVRAQLTNHLSQELMESGVVAGHMRFRPGFGFGYNGVVFTDPGLAGIPVGTGTYMWDGAADTWFWVDPEHDLLYVGLVQLMSYQAPALQEMTQKLMGDAILDRTGAR